MLAMLSSSGARSASEPADAAGAYATWHVVAESCAVREAAEASARVVATLGRGGSLSVDERSSVPDRSAAAGAQPPLAAAVARRQCKGFLWLRRDAVFEVRERRVNEQGLAARTDGGWISEDLNPLSGQRAHRVAAARRVALTYRVVLRDGAVVRETVELSSAIVHVVPCGARRRRRRAGVAQEKKLRLSQLEAVVRSDDAKADQRRRSSRLVVTSAARQGVKEVASGFGTLGPPPRWLKPLVEAGANCDELVAALEAHDRELASTPAKARDAEDEARGATWLAGLRSAALETGRAEAEFGDVVVSALDFSAAVREDAPPAVTPESASGRGADPPTRWRRARGATTTPPRGRAGGGGGRGRAGGGRRRPRRRLGRRRGGRRVGGRLTPSFDDGDADDDATDAEPERPATPPTGLASPAPPADEALSPGARPPPPVLDGLRRPSTSRGSPTPTRGATPASRASTPPVDYDAGAVADHWS
ncbi:hypothetical protein JL720_11263 [Aureococcus anophagefferens]|nr:hypothetical protein JL720_11263 [Aureococcus anophagefferens]